MIFKIESIKNSGEIDKERIVIRAIQEGVGGDYLLLCARAASDDGSPLSGKAPYAFWFPDDLALSLDDLVVIYTKAGKDTKKAAESGKTSHFFYWHVDQPIWEKDRVAVLIHTRSFQALNVTPPPVDEDEEPPLVATRG